MRELIRRCRVMEMGDKGRRTQVRRENLVGMVLVGRERRGEEEGGGQREGGLCRWRHML